VCVCIMLHAYRVAFNNQFSVMADFPVNVNNIFGSYLQKMCKFVKKSFFN